MPSSALICVFFFQAEDGIRDFHVTGVQTCALPIYCPKHGKQDETFVCQHIVQGLREGRPYGFFYPASSDEKRPNAWCTVCNELVAEEDGAWTDQILEVAQVKVLCALCYDRAKEMNLEGGRKWWEFWKR